MDGRSELPSAIAERVRRHRARLDGQGLRIERHERGGEMTLDDVDGDTSGVLIVDALPRGERQLRRSLEDLRSRLSPGVEVRVVQRSQPLERSRVQRAVERVGRATPRGDHLGEVPAMIRSSGFTIASIERFDVERDDGASELWVDVIALDLDAEVAPED
ncbi:MAG: hypothetical protein HKO87_07380 [Acidimicrobiia bacterium]|nr:hypothetical protein [Acidimicrobiia bacterium]